MNRLNRENLKIVALLVVTLLWLAGCSASQMNPDQRKNFWGELAGPTTYVDRTVLIGPDTRQVTVTGGQVVRFVIGNQSFSWIFDGPGEYNFDLAEVAPVGMLDHPVHAYVDPDPRYSGGK